MYYINVETGSYPISEQEIRNALPTCSFPVPFVPPAPYAFVMDTPKPELSNSLIQTWKEGAPVKNGEQWERTWLVVSKFSEYTDEQGITHTVAEQEQKAIDDHNAWKASEVRVARNSLLSACDWTRIDDAPITAEKKAEWATYRQQLRDITTQTGFPWAVQWPEQPK